MLSARLPDGVGLTSLGLSLAGAGPCDDEGDYDVDALSALDLHFGKPYVFFFILGAFSVMQSIRGLRTGIRCGDVCRRRTQYELRPFEFGLWLH